MRGFLLAAALTAFGSGAQADATAMCLALGAPEALCTCATEALAAEIAAEDAALYDTIGTRYLANMTAGQGRAEAWDTAIAESAAEAGLGSTALLTRMNAAGSAHRTAMQGCG